MPDDDAKAFPLRTRVGHTTGVHHGAWVHAVMENIAAAKDSTCSDAATIREDKKDRHRHSL